MKRYLLASLIGAVIGAGYQAMYVATNEWYPVENLNPSPEAFGVDRASYDIFAKLARHTKYHPQAYRESLRRTDALLQLEKVLKDEAHPTKPTIQDALRAETYAHVAAKNANNLLSKIDNAEHHLDANRHVTDLDRFLDIHLSIVRNLCKNCL